MTRYNQDIETKMCEYFSRLTEKDQRHYAAQEASKLGYGGKRYICQLFGISEARLRRGEAELSNEVLYNQIPEGNQRHPGGGRKKRVDRC